MAKRVSLRNCYVKLKYARAAQHSHKSTATLQDIKNTWKCHEDYFQPNLTPKNEVCRSGHVKKLEEDERLVKIASWFLWQECMIAKKLNKL